MKNKDLKIKTIEELQNEVKELKSELFKLRFQHATNQLDNPIRMRDVKREIARAKTIITEKEMEKSNKA